MAVSLDLSELVSFLQDRISKAQVYAADKGSQDLEKEIREISDNAIRRWRGDYSPKYYGGNDSLENYTVVQTADDFRVRFDQQVASHQQNNDLVIDLVVGQGYHGGSPGEGANGIRWRTPVPYFTHWGAKAVSSDPIGKQINDGISKLNNKMNVGNKVLSRFAEKLASG